MRATGRRAKTRGNSSLCRALETRDSVLRRPRPGEPGGRIPPQPRAGNRRATSRDRSRNPRSAPPSALQGSCEAGLEGFGEPGPVQVLADENEGVDAGFRSPLAVEFRVEKHVDPLEHQALAAAFDAENTLHPVDVASPGSEELADPVIE